MHRIELNRPPARWTRCIVYMLPVARREGAGVDKADGGAPGDGLRIRRFPLTRIVALRNAVGGTLTAA